MDEVSFINTMFIMIMLGGGQVSFWDNADLFTPHQFRNKDLLINILQCQNMDIFSINRYGIVVRM